MHADPPVQHAGTRIGEYQLLRELGRGGMGVVFEAMHQDSARRTAIKVIHAELSQRPDMAARFVNEVHAVHIVRHPGIVDILDFGQLPDRTVYIVMEYLEGETLSRRLSLLRGHMPRPTAVRLAQQVAAVLAATHEKGIVHRDLKPENVMLVKDPEAEGGERAKILDFGIAKVHKSDYSGAGPTLVKTQTGVMMGTPLYMSPEQCQGSDAIDEQSDVYSLGVILYEMLSGDPPFLAKWPGQVMAMHILTPPRPLLEIDPTIPEELQTLVLDMLAKAPQDRPNMAKVAADLLWVLRHPLIIGEEDLNQTIISDDMNQTLPPAVEVPGDSCPVPGDEPVVPLEVPSIVGNSRRAASSESYAQEAPAAPPAEYGRDTVDQVPWALRAQRRRRLLLLAALGLVALTTGGVMGRLLAHHKHHRVAAVPVPQKVQPAALPYRVEPIDPPPVPAPEPLALPPAKSAEKPSDKPAPPPARRHTGVKVQIVD